MITMDEINGFFDVDKNTLMATANWDRILEHQIFSVLETIPQSKKWHGEGDVLEHTRRVVEYVCHHPIKGATISDRLILLTAALFHDTGKATTTVDAGFGVYHSYGHEFESEHIARLELWDCGVEFREAVCALVRNHMKVAHILDAGKGSYWDKIVAMSENVPSMEMIVALKNADNEGSVPDDAYETVRLRDKLNIVTLLSTQIGCFHHKQSISTREHQRVISSLNSKDGGPSKWVEICVLIGLPGSGKNYWIEHTVAPRVSDYAVISRDDIREELGLCKAGRKVVGSSKDEARVTEVFDSRLEKAIVDGHSTIIINNIDLSLKHRNEYKETVNRVIKSHNLKDDVGIYWSYVYFEAPSLETNISRRAEDISRVVFESLIKKFDWPTTDEYDEMIIVKQKDV